MVNGTRAIHNFITTISIHIAHAQIVVSLTRVVTPFGLIAVEHPSLLKLFTIPVECSQHRSGVVSSAHYNTGMNTIQVSHTSQITIASVGMIITPTHQIASFRNIVCGIKRLASRPTEHSKILIAG